MRKERVRFAPSPTGSLHIGNARTALFNYLFALQEEGSFVLRIEDTDEERSAPEYERQLMDVLRWLGLEWDEGPDRNGKHAPYRQSERLELYRAHARELLEGGKAYPCYCTDEELQKARSAMLRSGIAPKYPGTCRGLSPEERRARERSGRKPCIRFRIPGWGAIRFQDRIHGALRFSAADIGDFVLMRSNGMPSYNFAVVIDDRYMEITTVIRGEDHLANTPRQVLLYRELGWEPPAFAHHPLLMGADGAKLSKRHGVTGVEAFRRMGVLPEALVNYFALLGGNLVDGREIFTLAELADAFSLRRAGKSAAVFSLQKLLWVNQKHLRAKSAGELRTLVGPFLERAGYSFSGKEEYWVGEVVSIIAENVKTLGEAAGYGAIFFDDVPEYSGPVRARLSTPAARDVLAAFQKRFENQPASDKRNPASVLGQVRAEFGTSGRELFLPLRMALTGMESGPELDRILSLLDVSVILKRLQAAISLSPEKAQDSAGS